MKKDDSPHGNAVSLAEQAEQHEELVQPKFKVTGKDLIEDV